jgi:preprotein translocase subunit SecE
MSKKTTVVILLILAFLVAFHQFYYWNTWFSIDDIHHETFVVALVCLAMGIVLSKKLE